MTTTALKPRPSEVLRAHRDEVVALIAESGAELPRVFGSVARGTDTPESDLDILVRIRPEKAWDFVSLPRELSDLLGVHVDVVSEGGLKPKHHALLAEARPL
ncbi:MAG: nucleotidyltransferase domain-containing protein [Propionibacteriaceae bacterium]|nr:nucleotidyltransferase domain-containing protein [Propionibacteriaceae bacterium]